MSGSNYLEDELLDHETGVGSWTAPTTLYASLHTADPGEASPGANEVSGAGYARIAVTFGAASSGVAANTSEPTFTASGGSFGTITHVAIHDALTVGNQLRSGALVTPKTIDNGESIKFATGDLTLSND